MERKMPDLLPPELEWWSDGKRFEYEALLTDIREYRDALMRQVEAGELDVRRARELAFNDPKVQEAASIMGQFTSPVVQMPDGTKRVFRPKTDIAGDAHA
jgi:hypothetical protein